MAWPEKRGDKYIGRWRLPDGSYGPARAFDTKREAEAWAQAQEDEARDQRRLMSSGRLTMRKWLTLWLEDRHRQRLAGQIAPRTYGTDASCVDSHLIPRLGHHVLRDLSVADVKRMFTDMLLEGYAPGTVNTQRRVLSKALSDAVEAELVADNVARKTRPVAKSEPEGDPSYFTAEEFTSLLSVADDFHYGWAVMFSGAVGLRSSEVCGLRWSDLDLGPKPMYQIGRTIQRVRGEGLVQGPAKNRAAREARPLLANAMAIIERQQAAQARHRAKARVWEDDDVVFASTVGTPPEAGRLLQTLRRMMDAAGVPKERADRPGRLRDVHELRRTFTTLLMINGVPLDVVIRLGRWTDSQMIYRTYGGTDNEALRAALDGIDLFASRDDELG